MLPVADDIGKDWGVMSLAGTIPGSAIPFVAPLLLSIGGFTLLYLLLAALGVIGAALVLRLPELEKRATHDGRNDGGTMMHTITGWEVCDTDPDCGDALALAQDTEADWLPADDAGGVHAALLGAGRLPTLRGDNLGLYRWVEKREWWYRARFEAEAGRAAWSQRVSTPSPPCGSMDSWSATTPTSSGLSRSTPASTPTGSTPSSSASPPLPDVAQAEEDGLRGAASTVSGLRKAAFCGDGTLARACPRSACPRRSARARTRPAPERTARDDDVPASDHSARASA